MNTREELAILPVVRSSERITYKRCEKKWYWAYRRGLVPKTVSFGALDLGTWMHTALAEWYGKGFKRNGTLLEQFQLATEQAMAKAQQDNVPDYMLERAEELIMLGEVMAGAYDKHYGRDPKVYVLKAEIPLEFTMSNHEGKILAIHRLKPDLVFLDENKDVWLMEHKTGQSIQLGYLKIDDQARPYGAMTESALRKLGVISPRHKFRGIKYNFLRKAVPDERPTNKAGQYLNKNGSISKRQPPPYFVRHPVTLTNKAKAKTLRRIRDETLEITLRTLELRTGEVSPDALKKTPHKSCDKTCQFFSMCETEEEGVDIRDMERAMYRRQNPYIYEEDSTEDPASFEIT